METLLDLPDVNMVLTITMHKCTSLSVGTLIFLTGGDLGQRFYSSLVCGLMCLCMYRVYTSHLIFYISILDCEMTVYK